MFPAYCIASVFVYALYLNILLVLSLAVNIDVVLGDVARTKVIK